MTVPTHHPLQENCGKVSQILARIGEKWSMLVVMLLRDGPRRFNDIKRNTGGISQQEFNDLFGTSHGEPIINWAAQGQYAPGSTFKVTSTAAAVADGHPLDGLYACPASVSINGVTLKNDGQPSLGDMTFATALIQSCDTVYYQLGEDMYNSDDPKANQSTGPNAPTQKMQKMELDWGFGNGTGIDLPAESAGSIPTRQWLYYLWKDNAHTGQNWCKYGKQNGSYVQQIEYQDCQNGWQWEPGQAAIAAIGQGYVTVTPLQLANAYAALANGGTLYLCLLHISEPTRRLSISYAVICRIQRKTLSVKSRLLLE